MEHSHTNATIVRFNKRKKGKSRFEPVKPQYHEPGATDISEEVDKSELQEQYALFMQQCEPQPSQDGRPVPLYGTEVGTDNQYHVGPSQMGGYDQQVYDNQPEYHQDHTYPRDHTHPCDHTPRDHTHHQEEPLQEQYNYSAGHGADQQYNRRYNDEQYQHEEEQRPHKRYKRYRPYDPDRQYRSEPDRQSEMDPSGEPRDQPFEHQHGYGYDNQRNEDYQPPNDSDQTLDTSHPLGVRYRRKPGNERDQQYHHDDRDQYQQDDQPIDFYDNQHPPPHLPFPPPPFPPGECPPFPPDQVPPFLPNRPPDHPPDHLPFPDQFPPHHFHDHWQDPPPRERDAPIDYPDHYQPPPWRDRSPGRRPPLLPHPSERGGRRDRRDQDEMHETGFRGHRGREISPRFHEDRFDDGYHERRDAQRRKFLEERRNQQRVRDADPTLAEPLDVAEVEDPAHFHSPVPKFNVIRTVVPAETIFDAPGRAERPSHVSTARPHLTIPPGNLKWLGSLF